MPLGDYHGITGPSGLLWGFAYSWETLYNDINIFFGKLTIFLIFLFYSIMKFTCLEAITMPLLVQVGCCESWRIVGSPCIIKLTSFWLFSKAYTLWQFTNLSETGRSRYFHQPLYLRFILDYYEIHLFLTFFKDNRLGKLTIFWIFFF